MRNNAYRQTVTVHRVKWADVHFSVVRGCSVVLCGGVLAATQGRFGSYAEALCYNSGRWVSRQINLFNESLCGENQQSKKEFACPLITYLKTLVLNFCSAPDLLRAWSAPRLICSAPDLLRAWFPQRFCKFCLKASKIRWICLISSKNLCPKYRIFALFRLAFQARFSGKV